MNIDFAWDKNSLFQADIVGVAPRFKGQGHGQKVNQQDEEKKGCKEIGFSVKNWKAAEEAGFDLSTDLVNRIITEGLIPAEWNLAQLQTVIGENKMLWMRI